MEESRTTLDKILDSGNNQKRSNGGAFDPNQVKVDPVVIKGIENAVNVLRLVT